MEDVEEKQEKNKNENEIKKQKRLERNWLKLDGRQRRQNISITGVPNEEHQKQWNSTNTKTTKQENFLEIKRLASTC